MTFPEAMAAAIDGAMVRRDSWGARRALRIDVEPWNGQAESLLMVDRHDRGDVQPFPYHPKGDDLRALDWSSC